MLRDYPVMQWKRSVQAADKFINYEHPAGSNVSSTMMVEMGLDLLIESDVITALT